LEEITNSDDGCTKTKTILLTAIDFAQNTNSTTITLTATDSVPPSFTLETLPTEEFDCEPGTVTPPTVDPDCTNVEVTAEWSDPFTIPADQEWEYPYYFVITWVAADGCDNTDTITQTVKVKDEEAPTITLSVGNDDFDCPYTETYTSSGSSEDDNCGLNSTNLDTYRINGTCPCDYSLVYNYTAQDNAGLTAEEAVTITVSDTDPPVIHGVGGNATVEQGDPLNLSTLLSTGGTVYVTDYNGNSCTFAKKDVSPCKEHLAATSATLTFTDTYNPADYQDAPEYTITRTFYAEDECGNTVAEQQVITVVDLTPPTCPGNETIYAECDSIPPPCHPDEDVSYGYTQETTDTGEIRYWSITDESNNTCYFSHTIIVQDTTPPVFSREPADYDAECDCDVSTFPNLRAVDNCDTEITIAQSQIQVENAPGAPPSQLYKLVNRWIATDDAGNELEMDQTVTVSDTTKPVFEHADYFPSETVECDSIPYDLDFNDQVNKDFLANLNPGYDACTTDLTTTFSQTRAFTGTCNQRETITRTWQTATDAGGLSDSYTQVIEIQDTTPPRYTSKKTCLQPITNVNLIDTNTWYSLDFEDALPIIRDNCSPRENIQVEFLYCNTTARTSDYSAEDEAENCYQYNSADEIILRATEDVEAYNLQFRLTDECGTSSEATAELWLPLDEANAQDQGVVCVYAEFYNRPVLEAN